MDVTPKKRYLHEEPQGDVTSATSCCSNSSDEDDDDSAGIEASAVKSAESTGPTNIPQQIPLCLDWRRFDFFPVKANIEQLHLTHVMRKISISFQNVV